MFGDGEQAVGQFKPPYESFEVPDPTVAQGLVEHNTSHVYTTPGEGRRLGCSAWGRTSLQGAPRVLPPEHSWG